MAPSRSHRGDIPPVYKIDLSLPPAERYVSLATRYRDQLWSLTHHFDELVGSIHPSIPVNLVKRVASLFLRRLHTNEETEEIKGISKATGIDMYLLVALNVLLDLLMGCTSGAARSRSKDDDASKMLHFRTLDWGMDGLRQLLVQLEYVRSAESDRVLATSITYVGFVGVLTGVRKDLSLSLNFRPNHDMSSRAANYRFYASHLLVLLGIRRSISSLLREYLVPSNEPQKGSFFSRLFRTARAPQSPSSLADISASLPQTPTTAAYLIFCDGQSTVVLEKDHRSAVTMSSSSFIVATNSDKSTSQRSSDQEPSPNEEEANVHTALTAVSGELTSLEFLIEDSNERRACMQSFWDAKERRLKRVRSHKPNNNAQYSIDPFRRTRSSSSRNHTSPSSGPQSVSSGNTNSTGKVEALDPEPEVTASLREITQWVNTYPITNEMTHFAAIMDPTEGKVAWLRRYPRPLIFEDDDW